MSKSHKIYFTGLNALRFFAAFFVLIHHAETIRAKNGLPNFEHFSAFQNGSLAVSFFFVLSGFLITYLLLDEIRSTNTVNITHFYIRRVKRIWPLYFLLVVIGLWLIPFFLNLIHYNYQMPYSTTTAGILFALFLSFVVNTLYGSHLLEPLWSIGVEEYFYLIWAPFFKLFKNNPLKIIITVLFIKTFILVFYLYLYNSSDTFFLFTKEILTTLKFELMAIGGIGAYYIFKNKDAIVQSFLFNNISQVILYSLIVVRLFFHIYCVENHFFIYKILFQIPILGSYTEGVLFLWLIVNTSLNPKSFLKLKHPVLEKLGDISYGVYMYQMLVIFGCVLLLKKVLLTSAPSVSSLIFYICIITGVLTISGISKRYFENYFLKI